MKEDLPQLTQVCWKEGWLKTFETCESYSRARSVVFIYLHAKSVFHPAAKHL